MISLLIRHQGLLLFLLFISISGHSQQDTNKPDTTKKQTDELTSIVDQINFLEDLEYLTKQVTVLSEYTFLKNSPQSKFSKDALKDLNKSSLSLNDLRKASKETLSSGIDSTCGGFSFSYGGNSFFAFIADPEEHVLRLHGQGETVIRGKEVPFNTLSNIQENLVSKQQDVLMLTNGGMFTRTFSAEGLLIIDTQEIEAIDTGNSEQFLNFYFKPNGIFYLEKNQFKILETMRFHQAYMAGDINPAFATQSGPMLLLDGKIHDGFSKASKSEKIRSGVGELSNGRVIFIVSQTQLTFYDFSSLFQNMFSVREALFLDGAISKVYIKNLISSGMDHKFGPVISVSSKKK
jgi:uncharacterized protein YigE (DUF2233 family)